MADFKRRFTKEEFKNELFQHLHDMPKGHFKNKKELEVHAAAKAERYAEALEALDAAMNRVKKIAESHEDIATKEEADGAIKEINDAINAYGEASLLGNSSWDIFNAQR